jgi:type IV pilus assembly protein PilV
MTPLHAPPRARAQRGFMLIEVLVSAVIFAIGVLALIGLQGKMSRAQASAKDRTDAAYLASELQALMWSDLGHLSSYNNCPSTYAPCAEWLSKLGTVLPGSNGLTQTVTVGTGGVVNIALQWKTGQGDTHTYTTSTTIRAAQ